MNRKMRIFFFQMLFTAVLLGALACQKSKPAEQVVPSSERVGPSPMGTSQSILHKSFAVRTTVAFPFDIPPHAAMPHLRGNYKSFVTKLGIQSNEDSANVDFLVLTDDQYADFVSGSTSALFSVDASHDQGVDIDLPPSLNQPKKYYLIFRNTPGSDAKKVVEADLTVDF